VRPNYAGGPQEIIHAFKEATEDVSVNRLIKYLNNLDYKYPYQNLLAFYMIENDYRKDSLDLIEKLIDLEFTMYIGYQILSKEHHLKSNVYYPKKLLIRE